MATIKLIREHADNSDDERDPWVIEVATVPRKGEVIYAPAAPESRHEPRGPGQFEVVELIDMRSFGAALDAQVIIRPAKQKLFAVRHQPRLDEPDYRRPDNKDGPVQPSRVVGVSFG
ncbi:MAG: hypothetical protein EOP84_04985 [Verrucomicrobiaceae bacterium]|nr:MAG: hypothetical protein EOP84_04985 [Verrucomicrobiaceae bacterium]